MLRNPDTLAIQSPHWRRTLSLWVLLSMSCGLLHAGAGVEQQFEAAYYREIVSGDLQGSMDQYRAILNQPAADRRTSAKALLQIGSCQEKLGQRKEAYNIY